MKQQIYVVFILIFLLNVTVSKAQDFYWIGFSDKNNTTYSLSNPEEYLSERAIQRRTKQNIPIDSLDLPVCQDYISEIIRPGVSLVHSSKWLNGITVKVETDNFIEAIASLSFVSEFQLTKPGTPLKSAINKFDELNPLSDNMPADTSWYGESVYQIGLFNGQFLHHEGYLGASKQIAVIDGGFLNADVYAAFDSLWMNNRILGTRDFVKDGTPFFQTNYHGMSVLSCMGGLIPGELVGTAPKASYWLIRSEDTHSEFIIEEDNWVAAAEFADSAGVDIINSSLGYFLFDDATTNHSYADMDGKTTRVTRGANIAASRGMLVFSSAGNEGNDSWKYIIAPSDGDKVIGVGATDRLGVPAGFTSYGPASDGDVKPNVSTMGRNDYLMRSNGNLGYASGTSFASPVMAGIAACLWEANPIATSAEIKEAIEKSAHLIESPDSLLGYGIPDMKTAHDILNIFVPDSTENKTWQVFPNPFTSRLTLKNTKDNQAKDILLSIFSVDGRLLFQAEKQVASEISINNLQSLPSGLLILRIDSEKQSESIKLSKIR